MSVLYVILWILGGAILMFRALDPKSLGGVIFAVLFGALVGPVPFVIYRGVALLDRVLSVKVRK